MWYDQLMGDTAKGLESARTHFCGNYGLQHGYPTQSGSPFPISIPPHVNNGQPITTYSADLCFEHARGPSLCWSEGLQSTAGIALPNPRRHGQSSPAIAVPEWAGSSSLAPKFNHFAEHSKGLEFRLFRGIPQIIYAKKVTKKYSFLIVQNFAFGQVRFSRWCRCSWSAKITPPLQTSMVRWQGSQFS